MYRMALISSVAVLIFLTICSARPPQAPQENDESNDIFEILRENGVNIPEVVDDRVKQPPQPNSTTTPRPWTPTTIFPPNTTTPYTTTTTPRPWTPTTIFPPSTTTPSYTTTTTTTPNTTTTTTTQSPTTTPPTPRMKLVKKKVITIEDFEADSEL